MGCGCGKSSFSSRNTTGRVVTGTSAPRPTAQPKIINSVSKTTVRKVV